MSPADPSPDASSARPGGAAETAPRARSVLGSIKVRTITVGIALVAGAIALITTILYLNASRDLAQLVAREQRASAVRLATVFDENLTSRRDALARVAGVMPLEALRDPPRLQDWLENRQGMASLFPEGLSVISGDGETLADLPANAGRRGTRVARREWFGRLRETARPVVSEPYVGGASGRPVLVIAAPVSRDGRLDGALVATVYLDEPNFLTRALASAASGGETAARLYVLSKASRVVVAAHDAGQVLGPVEGAIGPVRVADVFADRPASGVGPSAAEARVQWASAPMSSVPWHVVVETPTEIALAPVSRFAVHSVLWGAVVCLLSATALWLLAARMLRPVEHASRVVERALADPACLTDPIPAGGDDEIGTLLRGFSRLQERLRESAAEMQVILENSSVGIALVRERRIVWANARLGEMLGRPAGDLVGTATAEFYLSAEDHAAFGRDAYAALERSRRYATEIRLRGRGPDPVWMRLSGQAIRHGAPLDGSIWVFEDVSERRRIDEELDLHRRKLSALVEQRTAEVVASESMARLILESSADGLFGMDADGRVTFINPAGCRMLGYAAQDLVGRSFHELAHHSRADGSPYPSHECPSLRVTSGGQPARVDDEVFWHADGRAIRVMYATHPITRDGAIAGTVTSFVDVTQQHAAAQARERALEAAERLATLRREFLANMSHEIRTPLNGVLGFAAIGRRRAGDPDAAREAFDRILASGERLLGVINDVLDFSRIESGKLRVERTRVVLREVVGSALEVVGAGAHDKGLPIRVLLPASLPREFVGDPLRVGQALLNLLSNAVKFTERGSVTVEVEQAGATLTFRVIDTGVGMTGEQLAGLFDPFQQGDGSTTRRYGGTGLGLAITRRLVEAMGGAIRVRSVAGEGSTFEFTLPYVEVGSDPEAQPDPGIDAGAGAGPAGRSETRRGSA